MENETESSSKSEANFIEQRHKLEKELVVANEALEQMKREMKYKTEDFEVEREQLNTSLKAAVERTELLGGVCVFLKMA